MLVGRDVGIRVGTEDGTGVRDLVGDGIIVGVTFGFLLRLGVGVGVGVFFLTCRGFSLLTETLSASAEPTVMIGIRKASISKTGTSFLIENSTFIL